jgi:hypothetical protein
VRAKPTAAFRQERTTNRQGGSTPSTPLLTCSAPLSPAAAGGLWSLTHVPPPAGQAGSTLWFGHVKLMLMDRLTLSARSFFRVCLGCLDFLMMCVVFSGTNNKS